MNRIDPDRPLRPVSDETELKRAFSCFPSGVVAVCRTGDDPGGDPIGMSASAFTTVSLDPPLVSVCVRNGSTTWPALRGGTVGVSVFAAHQGDVCRRLAGPPEDRFTGVRPIADDSGAVFIPGAAAHLACTVFSEIPAGDHLVVLLTIDALRCDPNVEPLVFHASSFRALEARRAQS
ncbi:flavin reductase family protein [Gordonia sp. PS3]|uniref:Putative oxidoreductase n=1 Tax=Gordonia sihwensis NBRC 108236 TaxID=1223544 RepID=L7LEN7_9ACTN|nr:MULTISPECIES: flavin reductase family protein [Gordonia]AUH69891.1 flavin reductase [Gordonia sp. YC-JH1]KJR05421.1 flavin reductase [Gordonia sihwensis]KXT57073.1 flavin reductase [Gordonia sp. QH-12]MBY4570522.1 flavin reductase [Gordonia sihwensis]WFN93502.1 flavin reductase family protein [Gordonia sihwensis]